MKKERSVAWPIRMAKTSWVAPLLVFFMSFLLRYLPPGRGEVVRDVILASVGSVFYLVGLVSGISALVGVRKYGRSRILVPAIIGSSLSALLLAIVVSNVWSGFARARNPQTWLDATASSAQKDLPRKVDDETEIVGVTAEDGRLIFDYRLVNYVAAEIDSQNFREVALPQLVASMCKPMNKLWGADFVFEARYSGSDEVLIADLELSASDCGVSSEH